MSNIYSDKTSEQITNDMLEQVDSKFDKREGAIIYDSVRPSAIEASKLYIQLDVNYNESFGSTATREPLILRAMERGLSPYEATASVGRGKFNLLLNEGTRFSINELNFSSGEQIIPEIDEDGNIVDTDTYEDGYFYYQMNCETPGVVGNQYTDNLIPVEEVQGLTTAYLEEIIILGSDEEDTEDFRDRYLASFHDQAYGGNVADYKEKTNSIGGVGATKVIPIWNGGGTVKVIIVDSDYGVPTSELIDLVQTTLDPEGNQGEGIGLAPIGHVVTVVGATSIGITITTNIELEDSYEAEAVATNLDNAVKSYLYYLRSKWDEQDKLTVRTSGVEVALLEVDGVKDIYGTTINGNSGNLQLDNDVIPIYEDLLVTLVGD